ncbi:hypothetical protein GDO81_012047 [Engystomops pustulosus]|uniref:UDENN domain-containing protein n=1 Tax=Engystomops pustulosus TaxID=76066 RepID=A0AAV7BIW9_ENGPU|nr:hypothetical protein GDO81_012047 [Engystomops pustulosus]
MDAQDGQENPGGSGRTGPVLHIVVVGFHHKKGCQVEFSYPPLIPEEGHDSNVLPEEWKYLPFLALPDGAHNFQEDTVFFHLPPRSGERRTVYGVSCYRQIEAKTLKVRQADVTRETVQKSVCVLSQLPLYGLLQAKLQLITHAYFEEKDFSQISILKELYEHMNGSLGGSSLEGSQLFLGLSPRDLVLQFRHKVLILFKLILLEKKVLFYVSPVNRLVGALMTVLSLFPGMIEHGLTDSSHYRSRQSIAEGGEAPVVFSSHDSSPASSQISSPKDNETEIGQDSFVEPRKPEVSTTDHEDTNGSIEHLRPPSHTSPESVESDWETLDPSILEECITAEEEDVWNVGPGPCELLTTDTISSGSVPITVQPQSKTGQTVFTPGLVSGLEEDKYGMPLAIFTKVEDARISIHDPELRKILNPTTADLRFIDHLVKHVTENRDDVFLDGTGWEGGDEWIRAQFALYLHSLLSASAQPENEKVLADYGSAFIAMWKITHNYRVWNSNKHPALAEVHPR